MSNETPSKGTMIRGSDGSLYYIPDDKMQSFKLPDAQTADARKMLDDCGAKAQGGQVPAMHGEGLVKPPTPKQISLMPDTDKLKSICRKKGS
jgi:hypothetical protein